MLFSNGTLFSSCTAFAHLRARLLKFIDSEVLFALSNYYYRRDTIFNPKATPYSPVIEELDFLKLWSLNVIPLRGQVLSPSPTISPRIRSINSCHQFCGTVGRWSRPLGGLCSRPKFKYHDCFSNTSAKPSSLFPARIARYLRSKQIFPRSFHGGLSLAYRLFLRNSPPRLDT